MEKIERSKILLFDLQLRNSGDASKDILKRFEFETKQRLKNEETIIIFVFGVNDSQFLQKENKHRISTKKFKENIQKLTKIAKMFSSKIVFLGLIPVDERKTTPISWDSNKFYRNEYF